MGQNCTKASPVWADQGKMTCASMVGLPKSEVEHARSRVVRVSSTSGRGGIMPVPLGLRMRCGPARYSYCRGEESTRMVRSRQFFLHGVLFFYGLCTGTSEKYRP